MAQIMAGDIRKGTTFEYKSGVYTVTEFQNVVTGQVLSDETFNPTAKLETAQVETKKMTYSYTDGEFYYFMDEEFNLTPLNYSQVEDALRYIRENDTVTVKFLYGNAFSVDPENFVELKVIEAEPGVRGNTATNVTKAAKVETGATFQVPMFVEEGDTIRIDTRTGEYMSRV